MNLGKCMITRAELYGVSRGLEFAWDAGHRRVSIHSDSHTVVALLTDTSEVSSQHAGLILAYRALLARDWEVSIHHIYREANFFADCIAHKGHLLPLGTHNISISDLDVCHWALYDLMGVPPFD
ncbi:unnamed protein product [Linum tenue]|uniref:RNase H type-1 domain-containing protein n=1 Tax=Linum tenue TaxID=586396 RepID=A0AAV0P173_9ROSI|nr:unnamed protein product [Linum tenue]